TSLTYSCLITIIPYTTLFRSIKQVETIVENLAKSPSQEIASINISKLWERDTVWFEPKLRDTVEQSANSLNYTNKRVVSGAGHDAQFIASYLPSTMIFVPSIDGKSHMENEKTNLDDCEKGINVMLHTVVNLMES